MDNRGERRPSGRFFINYCTPERPCIHYTDGGPLFIMGAIFEDRHEDSAPDFRIHASTPNPGSMLVVIGNGFPNDHPFETGPGHSRRIALGNRGYNATPYAVYLTDEFTNYRGAEGQFMFGDLAGSGAGYVCVDEVGVVYRSTSPCR